MCSLKHSQHGATLLELLTVISIVGIMAYAAVPQFGEVVDRRDLNTAKTTLIQTLNKARNIARAENTIVSVKIEDNKITLSPSNSSSTLLIKMPKNIVVSDAGFSFNAIGLIDGDGLASIEFHADSNSSLTDTVSISSTGMIAALQ